MRDYKQIRAWRLADDLAVSVYSHTRNFPKEELYGLTSQLRRAAYSVPANIAEGSARNTKKDYAHFLDMARASLTETQYFIHLSGRLDYLPKDANEALKADVRTVFACLQGLLEAVSSEI